MSDAEEERVLTELLERLPRPPAPTALHQRLAAMVAEAPAQPPQAETRGRVVAFLGTFAVAAAAFLLLVPRPNKNDPLLNEVVNDHLRVLYAQRPIEIESGGIHQVKPWFEGRVDFAPRVTVEDDPDFPLLGGSVGYVLDRKAATFLFTRRLHKITLLVFPSEGMSWPRGAERKLGETPAQALSQRGFNVLLFKRADLGYALISDLNMDELSQLGTKLAN